MSHLVGHRGVHLVADTGEHRVPTRGDGTRHHLGIERGEVGAGAPAPNQHHRISRARACERKRRGQFLGGVDTLHPGVDASDLKAQSAGSSS